VTYDSPDGKTSGQRPDARPAQAQAPLPGAGFVHEKTGVLTPISRSRAPPQAKPDISGGLDGWFRLHWVDILAMTKKAQPTNPD